MEKVVLDYSLQGSALFLLHTRENFMLITKKWMIRKKQKQYKVYLELKCFFYDITLARPQL